MSDIQYTDWDLRLAAQKQSSRDYAEALVYRDNHPEIAEDLFERSRKMLHLAERLRVLTEESPKRNGISQFGDSPPRR